MFSKKKKERKRKDHVVGDNPLMNYFNPLLYFRLWREFAMLFAREYNEALWFSHYFTDLNL